MQEVDKVRAVSIYHREVCSKGCQMHTRGDFFLHSGGYIVCPEILPFTVIGTHFFGCGRLFSINGNWKICYPHCMWQPSLTSFNGALNYVNAYNQPEPGRVFCADHCQSAETKDVPTTLKEFTKYSKGICACGQAGLNTVLLCLYGCMHKTPKLENKPPKTCVCVRIYMYTTM